MAAEKSTSARALKRRIQIKEAVSAVLERKGFRAMKLLDVAEEAKIAPGLFYHYFPDLRVAACEVLSEFIASLASEMASLERTEDRFLSVYRPTLIWARAYHNHPGLMRCLVQAADEIPEFELLWHETNASWTKKIARSITRQFPDAKIGGHASLVIAYALGSMIDGLLNEAYVHSNADLKKLLKTPEHAAELLAAVWYRALFMTNPPTALLKKTLKLESLVLAKPYRQKSIGQKK